MSVLFNAAPDRLLITSNVPPYVPPFTHMTYINCAGSTGALQTIVARLDDDLSPYIWFGILPDGSYYVEDSQGGGGSFGASIVYGEWVHVTLYRSFVEYRLWLDGVFISAVTASGAPTDPGRYECGGWRTTNGNRFNGQQGVQKAFSALLTDPQVSAEYGKAEPQLLTNLYGVWPLLSDTNDYSGNDNHWNATGLDFTGAIPGVDYGVYGETPVIPQIMLHRRQLCS